MDVISGCAGLSENVARQTRAVSSGQVTATESSLRTTVIGPGRTPVRSSGTDTARGCNGMRTSVARKARHMFMAADYRSNVLIIRAEDSIQDATRPRHWRLPIEATDSQREQKGR